MHSSLTSLWPVPVQLVALIATELRDNGVSTQELLADSAITEQMLFSSGTLLSYRDTVQIIERAIKYGGTISGEHGIGLGHKEQFKLEHGDSVDMMRKIKHQFDPHGILNPGKIFD